MSRAAVSIVYMTSSDQQQATGEICPLNVINHNKYRLQTAVTRESRTIVVAIYQREVRT